MTSPEFPNLSDADQQGIELTLLHTTGGAPSAKLLRALEADIYARELQGMDASVSRATLARLTG